MVPVKQWSSSLHRPLLRSQVRPAAYGPRSITGADTVFPLYRNVTIVPHGSVRWATPTRSFVSFCPHAVPFPYSPGPYQLMLGSNRHPPAACGSGTFFEIEPLGAAGWRTEGRRVITAEPGSTSADSGSTLEVEAALSLKVVDAAGDPADSPSETALSCAGSIDRSWLGIREPAGSGTATRADAAMSAANATMSLVRTFAPIYRRVSTRVMHQRTAVRSTA